MIDNISTINSKYLLYVNLVMAIFSYCWNIKSLVWLAVCSSTMLCMCVLEDCGSQWDVL
jgi:hypothetical protein